MRLVSAFLVPWWIVPQDDLVTKSDVATANGSHTRAHRCRRQRASSIIKIMLDGFNKLLIPFYVHRYSIGLQTFAGHVPCAVSRLYWTAPLAPGCPRHRPHKLLKVVTLTMQRQRGEFMLQDLVEGIYPIDRRIARDASVSLSVGAGGAIRGGTIAIHVRVCRSMIGVNSMQSWGPFKHI